MSYYQCEVDYVNEFHTPRPKKSVPKLKITKKNKTNLNPTRTIVSSGSKRNLKMLTIDEPLDRSHSLTIRRPKKFRMAFQHAAIFFTLIFLWFILANAQGRRESRFPHARSPQMRPTRGIEQLKYHNMDLSTARGYGKRAVNMHYVNNFLLEWIALETRMRNLGIPRSFLRDNDDIIPE